MKVMIVGGAGYIGSHTLLGLLDAKKHDPFVFDSLARGHYILCKGAPLHIGDLRNLSDIRSAFKKFNPDIILHFGALAYVDESMKCPEPYFDVNVIGTLNLLRVMREFKVNKIVFSSTCTVYGEPNQLPLTENHSKIPINTYGKTKLIAEQAIESYTQAYNFSAVTLRYFNAAGCDLLGRAWEWHEPETHLIPLVLQEALRIFNGGDPVETQLRVNGFDFSTPDGTCIRDYVHVSDLADAHLLSLERLDSAKQGIYEVYNLGNGSGYSVLNVIEVARVITGQPILFKKGSARLGDPSKLTGSSQKATSILGWRPKFSRLEDIIGSAWSEIVKKNAK